MRDCHMCGAFEAARHLVHVTFAGTVLPDVWCCEECYQKLISGEVWSIEEER